MIRKLYPPLAAGLGLVLGASLILWLAGGEKPGNLSWNLTTRKTVMTCAYKTFANEQALSGRYHLSKIVFTNLGEGPVRNLKVSYQIPDYISWTTPETYAELLPGQTVVDLYYPRLPSKVAELSSATPASLEIKIAWEDEAGKGKEEIVKRNFDLRGVNEFEYTSMPAGEIASWYDAFENDPLLASFVTGEDPVVKTLVAEINKYAQGTTAGIAGGAKEVARFMEVFYNYQLATGVRYTSAKGVPEELKDVKTLVQTIRLPRDVILTGNGLCIELALLWCSVMDHLGVQSFLVLGPGHAFAVAVGDKGTWIPIECTGIGGGPVGPITFEQAVKAASETLQKWSQEGFIRVLDVRKLQAEGVRPPELPKIDLKTVQETLEKRAAAARPPQPAPGPGPTPGPAPDPTPGPAPVTFQTYEDPAGLLSVAYPRSWMENPATVAQFQQLGVRWFLFNCVNPLSQAGLEVYHWKDVHSIDVALGSLANILSRFGVSFQQQTSQEVTIGSYRGRRISGTVINALGQQYITTGIYLETKQGVIAVGVGVPVTAYESEKATLEKILQSVKAR